MIESQRYQDEIQTLVDDPIILQMYVSLPGNFDDFDTWSFVSRAADEYHTRGGTRARSIGGPARALKALSA